jgi:hypothetical protein
VISVATVVAVGVTATGERAVLGAHAARARPLVLGQLPPVPPQAWPQGRAPGGDAPEGLRQRSRRCCTARLRNAAGCTSCWVFHFTYPERPPRPLRVRTEAGRGSSS